MAAGIEASRQAPGLAPIRGGADCGPTTLCVGEHSKWQGGYFRISVDFSGRSLLPSRFAQHLWGVNTGGNGFR